MLGQPGLENGAESSVSQCDNIFVNGNTGELRIGDLGLSRQLESQDTKNLNQSKYLTMAGTSFIHPGVRDHRRTLTHTPHYPLPSPPGTPAFMAPEFYSKEREGRYNEKVDIYAFGMCVLEMITQEYPYAECKSPVDIMKAVMAGTPPRVLERVKNQPAVDFIRRCLLGLPDDRPSAADLLSHDFMTDPTFDEEVALNRGNVAQLPFTRSRSAAHRSVCPYFPTLSPVPNSTAAAEEEIPAKNARFLGGPEPNLDPNDMSAARADRGADADVSAHGDAHVLANGDPNDVSSGSSVTIDVRGTGLDGERPNETRPPVERTAIRAPDQPQAQEPGSGGSMTGSLGSESDGSRSEVISREPSPAPMKQEPGGDRNAAAQQAAQSPSDQWESESPDLNHIQKIPSTDGSEGSNDPNAEIITSSTAMGQARKAAPDNVRPRSAPRFIFMH